MSSSNLTLRLLRQIDKKLDALGEELSEFKRETNERFIALETRVGNIEKTVSGLATHMFMLSDHVKRIDQRVRKVEARLAK